MNVRLTLRLLGGLLVFLAAAMALPLPFAFTDGTTLAFLLSIAASGGAGMILLLAFPVRGEIGVREGFGIVTLAWLSFSVFGALPFVISGAIPGPIDAVFESMSGFTTTGATVITDLAPVPDAILFWRALTHWLGGMGIIVLSLAILPLLGVGGMQLFQAEVPGPTADKLAPRIQDTAKALWGAYVLLTAVQTVLLLFGGMNLHEALCHAFATMATGGFSTENASVGAWGPYVHWVITLFMFLAGVNFAFHYAALFRRSPSTYLKSEELRLFAFIVLAATGLTAGWNAFSGQALGDAVRDAAFTVVSIVTTTGFATADYELWPAFPLAVIVALMLIGGCAGSTGGGVKVVRVLLVLKHAGLQLQRLIHPREVRLLKFDDHVVPVEITRSVLAFVILYSSLFVAGSLAMAACGLDLLTAAGSSIACLGNIGPAVGGVGPTDNYAFIPAAGKVVLIFLMLLGRLEVYTVLVLALPSFWRR